MEFLKKNYEKVILSVVLLGLAVAAGLLLTRVAEENRRLEEIRTLNLTTTPQELDSMDTSTNLALLSRVQRSNRVVLTGTNNLFNPVTWQRRENRLAKIDTGAEEGPRALQIVETKPLYFRVSFVGRNDQGGFPQYSFRIQREGAARPADRAVVTRSFTSVGSDNAGLRLRELRPVEEPTEFVFEVAEDRTQVVVGPGRDFERVMGYLATLRYDPESRTFRDKRVDETISLDGTTYKIVAITEASVTVEAPNKARTTVTTEPASVAGSP
jgi:hypothetical protein